MTDVIQLSEERRKRLEQEAKCAGRTPSEHLASVLDDFWDQLGFSKSPPGSRPTSIVRDLPGIPRDGRPGVSCIALGRPLHQQQIIGPGPTRRVPGSGSRRRALRPFPIGSKTR
jgi:hypothetical protein